LEQGPRATERLPCQEGSGDPRLEGLMQVEESFAAETDTPFRRLSLSAIAGLAASL